MITSVYILSSCIVPVIIRRYPLLFAGTRFSSQEQLCPYLKEFYEI